MKKRALRCVLFFMISVSVLLSLPLNAHTEEGGPKKLPPARKIPGLTADDKFPLGCVDCHINMPDINQDERISTIMSRWDKNMEPALINKAQAAAPDGVTLKGVHPKVPSAIKNIPGSCKTCHSNTSKTAPPIAPLLHSIHLTGGEDNHFLTIFQGECTHCHKMNSKTGYWSIPSWPEK